MSLFYSEHLFLIPVTVGWLGSSAPGCGSEVWLLISLWGPGLRGSSYIGYFFLIVMSAGNRARPTMQADFRPPLG